MARKYRVLSATAGFGLVRSGEDAVHVSMEETFGNPVFFSFFSRYLRSQQSDKKPWMQFWQEAEEFRTMPRGSFANKAARHMQTQFVGPAARFPVPISHAQQDVIRLALGKRTDAEGQVVLVRSGLFDVAQLEVFEELKAHTYDKFVTSAYFSGVTELKLREKEVPTIHHFYYLKRLGTGSFGEVFAVRKKDSHKKYALKVMSKHSQAQMSKRWAMYLRIECDVMASLSHPFLVNLNYSFQTPDAAFMVLDLVVGGDVSSFQQRFRGSPPTEPMLRFMAAQLASGIEYLHTSCIIHRDIKPPNVLLDEEGHIRITDFGLSLSLNHGETLYDRTGTKPYMAPELHLASKSHRRGYSFAIDWFALGVTLWEVMSGGVADPAMVQSVLQLIKSGQKLAAEHFADFTHDEFGGPAEAYMGHLSANAKDFLASLLARDPSKRLGDEGIRAHPFFEEVNWAALVARRVEVPWGHDVLRELQSKRVDEALEERRTAAQTLGGMPTVGPRLDRVENFDFVSPRAVMEEYMENIYQLRQDDGS